MGDVLMVEGFWLRNFSLRKAVHKLSLSNRKAFILLGGLWQWKDFDGFIFLIISAFIFRLCYSANLFVDLEPLVERVTTDLAVVDLVLANVAG
jgi:hypothetical protein